jgi:hypothetical protein
MDRSVLTVALKPSAFRGTSIGISPLIRTERPPWHEACIHDKKPRLPVAADINKGLILSLVCRSDFICWAFGRLKWCQQSFHTKDRTCDCWLPHMRQRVQTDLNHWPGDLCVGCKQAKPSQAKSECYLGKETCTKRKLTSLCLLAISAFDRIAVLRNRHIKSNWGICLS